MFARIGVMFLVRECALWLKRVARRKQLYELAQARARELGRPLVVVGDVRGGVTHRGYGYGDLCVDLTGCPDASVGVRADVSKPKAIPLGNDSAVVFVSCVLEFVPNIDAAWREILRVAGSPFNTFVVHLEKFSVAAYAYPGVKWIVEQAPPESAALRYRPMRQRPKLEEVQHARRA